MADENQNTDPNANQGDNSDFDASKMEVTYGLPEGTLQDVKTEDEANQRIREHVDKLLSAGLMARPNQGADPNANSGSDDSAAAAATKQGDAAAGKEGKDDSGNTDMAAIQKKLQEMEQRFQQQEEEKFNSLLQEAGRRLVAEVDSWESPKYGKGSNRNYNQLKAVEELRDLVTQHVAGAQVQGKNPPTIEAIARQVRKFHDDAATSNNKQDDKKDSGGRSSGQPPLGTPGGANKQGDNSAPRNIHQAFQTSNF